MSRDIRKRKRVSSGLWNGFSIFLVKIYYLNSVNRIHGISTKDMTMSGLIFLSKMFYGMPALEYFINSPANACYRFLFSRLAGSLLAQELCLIILAKWMPSDTYICSCKDETLIRTISISWITMTSLLEIESTKYSQHN